MALLYVDQLGVRSKWQRGGRAGAEKAFDWFQVLITRKLEEIPTEGILWAGLETDSAVMICSSALVAAQLGIIIYRAVFMAPNSANDDRPWIRGVITNPPREPIELRFGEILPPPLDRITRYTYRPEMLDALAAERAGFKGMRLLIKHDLISDEIRATLRVPIKNRSFIPFRHLDYSPYPQMVATFHDVLWMAFEHQTDTDAYARKMTDRLRWSAGDPDEFIHAAATQLVFAECHAIAESLRARE